jgi:ketosteroid isomerase-like protein
VRTPLPPIACVVSFIDAINHGDIEHLSRLMSDEHRLCVLDETPLEGKDANVEAWRGYATAFPNYVISPHAIVARADEVYVLGHTTGSHLAMPDDEESKFTVIWKATVQDGRLDLWQIIEDTPTRRAALGFPPNA